MTGPATRFLSRLLGVEPGELAPALSGFLMFFLLFAGYFMLRPVRETMGIAGGVGNLQWLFTGTFVATLAAIPLFGWVAAHAPRRRILPWTYGFFAVNLLGFAAAIAAQPAEANQDAALTTFLDAEFEEAIKQQTDWYGYGFISSGPPEFPHWGHGGSAPGNSRSSRYHRRTR